MGNATKRNYLQSFEYEFMNKRVDFQSIFTALSKQHARVNYDFLAGASEFGRRMGGSNFRDFLPIIVPKR